jgi:signal transduction histidine kinase
MQHVVLSALEESRRTTAAALYLRDPVGSDFVLGLSFGPGAPARIDGAAARPVIERLNSSSSIVLEELQREIAERRRLGWTREVEAEERLVAAAELLGPFKDGLALAIHGEDQDLLGMLLLMDDRVKDAFSPEEVSLLESLAVQLGVVVENSRQYRRMQERDRLAALGQMAAGLAHEVKNPLGAIKGAAQLLSEPEHSALDPSAGEFVAIILEEVDRLDRVVGSVLDYARPSKGNPGAVDVNSVVKGTLRVLASDRESGAMVTTELAADLPFVRADAEQLRQVLMNLVKNAIQAMNGAGQVTVSTRERKSRHPGWGGGPAPAGSDWVEVSVRDVGPGIGPSVLKNIFVPFFTTKHKGTGLGLAISQRMIEEMGGRIEVSSQPGAGSTFTVMLPVVSDPLASPRQLAAAPAGKAPTSDAEAVPRAAQPEVKPA